MEWVYPVLPRSEVRMRMRTAEAGFCLQEEEEVRGGYYPPEQERLADGWVVVARRELPLDTARALLAFDDALRRSEAAGCNGVSSCAIGDREYEFSNSGYGQINVLDGTSEPLVIWFPVWNQVYEQMRRLVVMPSLCAGPSDRADLSVALSAPRAR